VGYASMVKCPWSVGLFLDNGLRTTDNGFL
jgi:hypothetical protein